jgi:hypothetical protein
MEINGASNLTIGNLQLTGAYNGILIVQDSNSSDIVLDNLDIYGTQYTGISVERGNGLLTVENSRFQGSGVFGEPGTQQYGILTYSPNMIVRDSSFTNNFSNAISVSTGVAEAVEYILIENSTFEGVGSGVSAFVDNTTVTGSLFSNIVGKSSLIIGGENSIVRDNIVHNSGVVTGLQFGAIHLISEATATNNIVYDSIVGISGNAETKILDNTVFGGERGIFSAHGLVEGNRVFGNSVYGIQVESSSQVIGNKVYNNEIGIWANGGYTSFNLQGFYGNIDNNIVYGNGSVGIQVNFGRAGNNTMPRVRNNTIYQPAGDAILIRDVTAGYIKNNILRVDAGSGINIDSGSNTTNLEIDHNLFFLSNDPNARIAEVNEVFADTLSEWTSLTANGSNSLIGDPLFFDENGADDIEGYFDIGGILVDGGVDDNFHLLKLSDAIDRGVTWVLGSSLFDASRGVAQGWNSSNGVYSIDLPFEFTFYDQTYTQIEVSTSGMIGLPTVGSNLTYSGLPYLLPRVLIAAYWGNTNTTTGSGRDIFVDTSVEGEVYIRYEARSGVSSPVRYAILLKDDGSIRFDYGTGNNNISPTVGISAGNRTDYTLIEGYDQSLDLGNAPSVNITLLPGITDIGAYEFKGDSGDNQAPLTLTTLPGEIESEGHLIAFLDRITIQLSESIDTIDAISPATFQLILDGNGDGLFNELDTAYSVTPNHDTSTNTISLQIDAGFLPAGNYQFRIKSANLRDVSGNQLDGSGSGAGSDYLREFSLVQPILSEVTSDSESIAVRGEAFSFQVTATENPLSFSAIGLPNGITIDSETGLISGITDSDPKLYEITILVTNADGLNESSFDLVVRAAPQITETIINDGDTQRSTVRRIEIIFDSDIGNGLEIADIQLLDQATNTPVDSSLVIIGWSFITQSIILTFPGIEGGSIPEGAYAVVIASSAISIDGLFLDGDGDGAPGGDYVFHLHRLSGDLSGNRSVDTLDALLFRRSYESSAGDGAYLTELDFNHDGTIDSADSQVFQENLYTSIPAPQILPQMTYSLATGNDRAAGASLWLRTNPISLASYHSGSLLSEYTNVYDSLLDDSDESYLLSLYS